jgi:ubiquitin-like modifier-activating enzyme ATG7
MVGFIDPSSNDAPGWPLRNLLYLLNKAFGIKKIKILCYRGTKVSSFVLETELPESSSYHGK